MSQGRRGAWRGRGIGAASGVVLGSAVAAGAAAGPEYLPDPRLGIPVAVAAGLVAFGAGAGWDRRAAGRQAEQERRARWEEVFSDQPALHPPEAGVGDGVLEALNPQAAVVSFEQAHLRHVAAIRRWCTDRQPGRVWLLAGGPGTGKTRSAMRVAENLRRQSTGAWDCGWLMRGHGRAEQAVQVAASWPRPVVIAVDDAELREDLSALLSALHDLPDPQQDNVRVLLLSREFGGWWTELRRQLRTTVDTAAEHTWLGPLASDLSGQRVAMRRAIAAFTDHLGAGRDRGDLVVTGIQAGTPAMLLHATALEAVYQARDGVTAPVDVADAVGDLLDRERERWWREAARNKLHAHSQVTETVLRDALVLSMLVGAADQAEADVLLRRVPGLEQAGAELVSRLTGWLRLYGVVAGYHVRPHLPVVLAEHLIAEALAGNPALARAVTAAAATREQASFALAVVTRAATHVPAAQPAVRTLIEADPLRLLPLAITMARMGLGPTDQAIAAAVPAAGLDWDGSSTLAKQIPGGSLTLLHTAVALAHVRTVCAPDDVARATALARYATLLNNAGRVEQAVLAAEESVAMMRVLAEADSHQALLAYALMVLAGALRQADRPGPSATAADEAVAIRRVLAEANPDAYQGPFADALSSLSRALRDAGEHGRAVTAAQESVAIWRVLAEADPDAHRWRLADALSSLANALRHASRPQEAVTAAYETVAVRRALAEADPDAHQNHFASALSSLANALRRAGKPDQAVVAAHESVAIWRALTAANPDAHQRFLAYTLSSLADALRAAGRPGEAVTAAQDAVAVRRAVAESHPDANQSHFASSLTSLANALRAAGEPEQAVVAARESVAIWRALAETDPRANQDLFASSLSSLAQALWETGRPQEAATAAHESVAIWRTLSETDPDTHQVFLTGALTGLANILRDAKLG